MGDDGRVWVCDDDHNHDDKDNDLSDTSRDVSPDCVSSSPSSHEDGDASHVTCRVTIYVLVAAAAIPEWAAGVFQCLKP